MPRKSVYHIICSRDLLLAFDTVSGERPERRVRFGRAALRFMPLLPPAPKYPLRQFAKGGN